MDTGIKHPLPDRVTG